MKFYCFRTLPGSKGKFVPKGFPIGFEMAEKKPYKHTHTDRHFRIYISRDIYIYYINRVHPCYGGGAGG